MINHFLSAFGFMTLDSSNQLKLHSSRQEQLSKSTQYIQSFLNNLDQSTAYQVSPCPTCSSIKANILFEKNGGQYAFCTHCEHVFLAKSLKPGHLIDFYSNYPTSSLDWHQNESDFYIKIYNSGLDMIDLDHKSAKLLDIGCSGGLFLSMTADRGYVGFGVEPNAKEPLYAREHGINVVGKTIYDLSVHEKYDVITMWDVLEHIDSPVDYIQKLKHYLSPGGVIFVQVPTCDSIAARIMREKSNMFDGIEHLTLFSNKSLDLCFSRSGFIKLNTKSVISDVFALKNYLLYEADPYLPSSSTPSHSFTDLINFDAIEANSSGYKIQACYQLLP